MDIFEKKRCTRCVLPEDFPNIEFDENGVCNYCNKWDAKWKKFDYVAAEKELNEIFQTAKKKGRQYDCLIPFSGGRDSSYVLYLCKEKYGLKPLAVTFNNGFLSKYALENMFNTVKVLGVDHVIHTYNWKNLQKFYSCAVKNSGEFCSICSAGINLVTNTYQRKFKIPLIISGTSTRVDEQSPFEIISSNPKYLRRLLKNNTDEQAVDEFVIPHTNELKSFDLIKILLSRGNYVSINLPDYLKWDNDELQDVLMNKLNWKTPDKKSDHIDCKYACIKTYFKNQQIPGFIFKQEKFSQLIRDGQITRDYALKELKKYVLTEKEPTNLNEFLADLNLKKKRFS